MVVCCAVWLMVGECAFLFFVLHEQLSSRVFLDSLLTSEPGVECNLSFKNGNGIVCVRVDICSMFFCN